MSGRCVQGWWQRPPSALEPHPKSLEPLVRGAQCLPRGCIQQRRLHPRARACMCALGGGGGGVLPKLTEVENFSVPSSTPDAYTSPGMSDFVIWMNDTERYRYDALDSQRLAAYRNPAPAKHYHDPSLANWVEPVHEAGGRCGTAMGAC